MGGVLCGSLKTSFPEDYKSRVGDWLEHRQDLGNLARAKVKHVRERELTTPKRTRRPATFKVGQLSAGPLLWALSYYKDRWIQDPGEVQPPPRWGVAVCT